MKLFCFASRNQHNIALGVQAGLWATATVSFQAMRVRKTKADRYFRPGDRGLLYCNPTHSFTTPFLVESDADQDAVVTDVWPEPWVLPFKIKPLGSLARQLHATDAAERWPIAQKRIAETKGRGGISAAMHITGATVFTPLQITDQDWEIILSDLATRG